SKRDWSSDVCSSDLKTAADIDQQAQGISPVGFARIGGGFIAPPRSTGAFVVLRPLRVLARPSCRVRTHRPPLRSCWVWAVYKSWYIPPASNSWSWDPCSKIGRASCRERVE